MVVLIDQSEQSAILSTGRPSGRPLEGSTGRLGLTAVNVRPYYAEGSKTLAFETAERLGWRLPDHMVAPGGTAPASVRRQLAAVGSRLTP